MNKYSACDSLDVPGHIFLSDYHQYYIQGLGFFQISKGLRRMIFTSTRLHKLSQKPVTFFLLLFWILSTYSSVYRPGQFPANPANRFVGTSQRENEAQAVLTKMYGKLPRSFEANEGQINSDAKFFSRGTNYNLYLSPSEVAFAFQQPVTGVDCSLQALSASLTKYRHPTQIQDSPVAHPKTETKSSILRMKLVGTNPGAQIEGRNQLVTKTNYLFGNDPNQWHTNIPNYSQVACHNVYSGIDVVYYDNQQQLEYDFIVSPGSDVRDIRLTFEGLQDIQIAANGDLLIDTAAGMIRQPKPFAYQEIDGTEKEISAEYVLKNNQQVEFQIADYDLSQPLIIDPVMGYSSYIGGQNDDMGLAVSVDQSGNAYIGGTTTSPDFPLLNPWQNILAGALGCGFISKMNSTGTALIYSTYIRDCAIFGIAVNTLGQAYATGRASSNFITTAGAFNTTVSGRFDAFVLKLNTAGNGVIYSTVAGGDGDDTGNKIKLGSDGSAYIAGISDYRFPTTPGAFQVMGGGGGGFGDPFIAKFDPAGAHLTYATYLGGSDYESCFDMALDNTGCVYVVGATRSSDFPLQSPLQATFGGFTDGFVTKLNKTGTGLEFSTYLGGSGGEYYGDMALAVALDHLGNIYVGGRTESANFPVTPGALQTIKSSNYNGFVSKLNPAGNTLLYSTYLGGTGSNVTSIKVDQNENAILTGTVFGNFPVTADAFQSQPGGSSSGPSNSLDGFAAKLNASGSALLFATYLGGNEFDEAIDLSLDKFGNAFIVGRTESLNFPTTAGAFQPAHAPHPRGFRQHDAFITKISFQPASVYFDFCLQDESNGNILQINSLTGEYQMINCSGFGIGGTGTVTKRGNIVMLQHNTIDRRISVSIDINSNRASASIQIFSQGRIFSITDRNILNNTCQCQ